MTQAIVDSTETLPFIEEAKLSDIPSRVEEARLHTKPSKPQIEPHFHTKSEIVPTAIIFANMLDNMQRYAQSTAEPAELRHAQVGKNIQKISNDLKDVEHKILDTKQNIATWESRTRISNYVLNGVTAITGIGLVAAGDLWTGGSLIVSGVGSAASTLMSSYGWDPTLTSAISIVSGLVGVVGGIGSIAKQLYSYGPLAFLDKLTSPSFSSALQFAGSLASLASTAFTGYAQVERNTHASTLSQYEAGHTQKTTQRQLLEPKLASATTSHQGTAKNMAKACRAIVSAQTRFTRDAMRQLTADFPA
jgi:hypothetical protein